MREFTHFALTTGTCAVADNRRPHKFEFSLEGFGQQKHVVMRYYHWCHDTDVWNGSEPIIMFNYVPKLDWLQPARLRPNTLELIANCTGRCKGGLCPRCNVEVAFRDTIGAYQGSRLFTPATVAEWEQVFTTTTTASAHATLPVAATLPVHDPLSVQASTFEIPMACRHPTKELLAPPVRHSPEDIALHKLMAAATNQRNVATRQTLAAGDGAEAEEPMDASESMHLDQNDDDDGSEAS